MADAIAQQIRQAEVALRTARELLAKEIRAYPTPISGCDAQFNWLLDQRHRLQAAEQALTRATFVPTPRSPDSAAVIEAR